MTRPIFSLRLVAAYHTFIRSVQASRILSFTSSCTPVLSCLVFCNISCNTNNTKNSYTMHTWTKEQSNRYQSMLHTSNTITRAVTDCEMRKYEYIRILKNGHNSVTLWPGLTQKHVIGIICSKFYLDYSKTVGGVWDTTFYQQTD